MRAACFAALLLLVGCSAQDRLKVKSIDDAKKEMERVTSRMPEAKAAEFDTAAKVLTLIAMKGTPTTEVRTRAVITALDGKTPDAIISEYNNLDPALRGPAEIMVKASKAG